MRVIKAYYAYQFITIKINTKLFAYIKIILYNCIIIKNKKHGKIKITDKINFYNCDCMEFMKTIPAQYYDLAIVDPPYNLGNKLVNGGTWSKKWKEKGADWDIAPKKEYFEELFRVS